MPVGLLVRRIGDHLAHHMHRFPQGQHPFGGKVYPFNVGNRREIPFIGQVGGDLPAKHPRHQICTAAAADHFQSLRRHKIRNRTFVVLFMLRRPGKNADNLLRDGFDGSYRGVVPRLTHIQVIARVTECGGDARAGVFGIPVILHEIADAFPVPAEIHHRTDPGINHPVTHHGQRIPALHVKDRFQDGFAPHLSCGILDRVHHTVMHIDAVGAVKFGQICLAVIGELENRKGGIGHMPHLAHRQGVNDGVHRILKRGAGAHHGGDDF